MDGQKKPFDTVSIVFLLIVAAISDIADLVTDLFFLVPIVGQAVFMFNSLVISPIVWAIIQFSFIIKTGAKRTSLIPVIGGLGNIANIPGSETITTIIGILMANKAGGTIAAISPARAGIAAKGAAAERGVADAKKEVAGKRKVFPAAGRGAAMPEEGAGRAAPEEKPATPKGREVLPEELGEMKSPFEELQELMKKPLVSEKHVQVDDEKNEIDLRKTK